MIPLPFFEGLLSFIIYSVPVVTRHRIADGVPPADIDGEMDAQLGEEMVVEVDAAADAAQEVADAF